MKSAAALCILLCLGWSKTAMEPDILIDFFDCTEKHQHIVEKKSETDGRGKNNSDIEE